MSRSMQLALILALPVAILAAMIAIDRTYGLPGRGYDYVLHIQLPSADGVIGLPEVYGPPDASRPLVVLDPGHGGHDPGAGHGAVREKDVTLALAKAIREKLIEAGGIRVALTREDDRYLMLGERSSIARRLGADLFLSIHADSAGNGEARGASVYVLSEKGSNQAAAKIAARENQSDVINGVRLAEGNETVNTILLDLSQSEAQAGSNEFAHLILRELRGKTDLHFSTVQSAAFAVLKAPDMPSVLFETGYVSNPGDAAYLSSNFGRETISGAASQAIRAYFARQAGV
jgi:N-acetylmuramoyl-L-alanine amidase